MPAAEGSTPKAHATSKPRTSLFALMLLYQTLATPSKELMGKEELERFETAFARMPEHQQQVILLSRVVGLSHKEIAETMERTESSTRNLLYRALAELAEMMGKD